MSKTPVYYYQLIYPDFKIMFEAQKGIEVLGYSHHVLKEFCTFVNKIEPNNLKSFEFEVSYLTRLIKGVKKEFYMGDRKNIYWQDMNNFQRRINENKYLKHYQEQLNLF